MILAHDLPEPKINYVLTLPSGRTVYLDMAYPEWKICVEYDGKRHAKTRRKMLSGATRSRWPAGDTCR